VTKTFSYTVMALVTLAFMGSVAFAVPKVEVTVSSTSLITISTKLYKYTADAKTGVLTAGYLALKHNREFWVYSGDGFVLYASNTVLKPIGWSINGKKKSFSTKSDVTLVFFYNFKGQEIKKSITFVNGPNYEMKVAVNGPKNLKMLLTFPTLMSKYNEVNGALFTTYSSNLKTIGVETSTGKFNINGFSKFTGTLEGRLYFGPVKNSLIFAVFPHHEGLISEILKGYPGSEPFYGWFLYLFVRILNWIYSWTGNYGWAIIIFAVLVKLVLYPLSHIQMKSMVQMRKIQPKMKEIQKKYKDPKKQQEELMKLYKAEGINPASGCLPMLIQLPVLFLLYYVIMYSRESFTYNPPFLIWNNLSVGGFGPNIILILIIVVLSSWSTLWTSTNAKQAWQGIAMFSVMEFFFVGFPVGLFLYYAVFSAMQLITTYIVAKIYNIKGITIRELFGMNPKRRYRKNIY